MIDIRSIRTLIRESISRDPIAEWIEDRRLADESSLEIPKDLPAEFHGRFGVKNLYGGWRGEHHDTIKAGRDYAGQRYLRHLNARDAASRAGQDDQMQHHATQADLWRAERHKAHSAYQIATSEDDDWGRD